MPNYAKFMKDILSKKKKIYEEGIVSLTATFSAVIQKSLPAKMKDPSSFTIPYSIGKCEFKEALCDLGANINLNLGDEAVQFNLYNSLTQPDVDAENCMAVDSIYTFSFELNSNFNL